MPEIRGNDPLQTALSTITGQYGNSAPTGSAPSGNGQSVSGDAFQNALNNILKAYGQQTSNPVQNQPEPQPAPAPKKKKKKKRGFFSKIGRAFKKVGNVLKKALPIVATVAAFIPGLQPLALAAKIGSAAMGAIDAIKNKNPLGFLGSVAGAFTGGLGNIAGKASGFLSNLGGGVGNFISKGVELFNQGKGFLTNFTSGIGGKVTDWLTSKGGDLLGKLSSGIGGKIGEWLTSKGPDLLKNFATNAGNRVTNWLNDKATQLFNRVTQNPIVDKVRNFMSSDIGKFLLDIFAKKS